MCPTLNVDGHHVDRKALVQRHSASRAAVHLAAVALLVLGIARQLSLSRCLASMTMALLAADPHACRHLVQVFHASVVLRLVLEE